MHRVAAPVPSSAPSEPRRYAKAQRILAAERDRALSLDAAPWPPPELALKNWDTHHEDGALRRIIDMSREGLSEPLEETMLRFPSAPVHGLQRLHEYHVRLDASENFHTYRVLRSARAKARGIPVTRIFLMHTGLNERDNVALYYRLAAHLTASQAGTACVLRPFPGHLTRFPFQAFAETPLEHYLWDGSHLFRQFIRYMLETQWFLSALVRRSSYRCASGANLLAEADVPGASRLNRKVLAKSMGDAWRRLHLASLHDVRDEHKRQPGAAAVNRLIPEDSDFEAAIRSLRVSLNLVDDYPDLTGDLESRDGQDPAHVDENAERGTADGDAPPDPPDEPAIHVLGYSLGGYTAQSVFMAWPFLVSSCATLLGGGALRQLAPVAFADPEEWQTVLHSLRYELDDRLLRLTSGIEADATSVDEGENAEESIVGVDLKLFSHFKRTFYEVFHQDHRGSAQTRLAEFRNRMLFIVGGNDPVVRPQNVMEASPPGGVNLLEVGGVGHFLEGRPKDREEGEQRAFWVPQVAGLIDRCADHAAQRQDKQRPYIWLDVDGRPNLDKRAWDERFADQRPRESRTGRGRSQGTTAVRRLGAPEMLAIPSTGALAGELFERCLDDLLARLADPKGEGDSVLFILRNEMPTMLLHDAAVRERAAAMYHDDFGIVRFFHGATKRRQIVQEHIDKIALVLPWNAESVTKMDASSTYPSQSEAGALHRIAPGTMWQTSVDHCDSLAQGAGKDSIRIFDGNVLLSEKRVPDALRGTAEQSAGNEELARVASLPDCWVWLSREFLGVTTSAALSIDRTIRKLADVAPDYYDEPDDLLAQIHQDRVRMVTVSRARYNPRFRGRLIVDEVKARRLLLHVALCLSLSRRLGKQSLADAVR